MKHRIDYLRRKQWFREDASLLVLQNYSQAFWWDSSKHCRNMTRWNNEAGYKTLKGGWCGLVVWGKAQLWPFSSDGIRQTTRTAFRSMSFVDCSVFDAFHLQSNKALSTLSESQLNSYAVETYKRFNWQLNAESRTPNHIFYHCWLLTNEAERATRCKARNKRWNPLIGFLFPDRPDARAIVVSIRFTASRVIEMNNKSQKLSFMTGKAFSVELLKCLLRFPFHWASK